MEKQGQSSFIETLIRLMPDLGRSQLVKNSRDYVNSAAATSLFSIWKSSSEKGKVFRKPVTMPRSEIENMKNEGLIRAVSDRIEMTDKGEEVIKVMILGDSKSCFEEDGIIIDYNQALANTRDIKTAKKSKVASSWWDRFNK